ncbi:hypothetical protein HK11_07550 [Acetobacter sp. DmW_043]|nr:hypothetical protein HK11_07550 [Acetobacter sp. DmW_043]
MLSGATATVTSGGTIAGATIGSGGVITASSGGSVTSTFIGSGGTLNYFSGGFGNLNDLNAGGTFNLARNFIANHNRYLTASSGAVINVLSGGALSGGDALSGGTINLSSGGVASGTIVSGGGTLAVLGVTSATSILSGGAVTALSGGTVASSNISSGGELTVSAGAVTTYTTLLAGGTLNVGNNFAANHSASKLAVSGGAINVLSGGVLSGGDAGNSGTITVSGNGSAVSTFISSGGVLDITSGGIAMTTAVSGGGSVYVASGGTVGDTTISSGAILTADAGSVISGNIITTSGATVTIPSTAGGTVTLNGDDNNSLIITGQGNPNTVIMGFSEKSGTGITDGVTFESVKTDDVVTVQYPDENHVMFTLKDGSTVTVNIVGVKSVGYKLASTTDDDLIYEICFLAGALIETPDGTVAVQNLREGDDILTWQNGVASSNKISWAGRAHRFISRGKSHDEAGYPVRIVKDAVAPGVPFEDLLVTSEHCLFFENRFIPARMLVNGRSIFYDTSFASYEYFHIETEDHSVIMANGMLTESYLDTGNRHVFRQDTNVITLSPRAKLWEEDAAAVLDVSREFAEPLFHRLNERAGEMGLDFNGHMPALTTDADLHLIAGNNMLIRPARQVGNKVIFMLPACVGEVIIASRSGRPADAVGPYIDDRRNLGVLVGQITLMEASGTSVIDMHLREDSAGGWSGLEHPACRWTTGRAHLSLCRSNPDTVGLLSVEVISAGPYLLEGDVTKGSLTA